MIPFVVTFAEFLNALWQALKHPRFRGLFLFVVSLLLMGMFFYHEAEGWSWLDALYFSVMTLTTVGYGDLTPTTTLSKVFTMIYIFVGLGTLLGFVNVISFHPDRPSSSDGGKGEL